MHLLLQYQFSRTGTLNVSPKRKKTAGVLKDMEYRLTLLGTDQEYTSVWNGRVYSFTGLPAGTYRLWESGHAEEYAAWQGDRIITIQPGKTLSETIEYKRASSLNLTIVNQKGFGLEEVTYCLYDSRQDLVGKATSDKTGHIVFPGLAAGIYRLEQTTSPKGYSKSAEPVFVDLKAETKKDLMLTLDHNTLDTFVKKILILPRVLAYILKATIPELSSLTIRQIIEILMLSDNTDNLDLDTYVTRTVSTSENESQWNTGYFDFDIVLKLRIPKEYIQGEEDLLLFINIESQDLKNMKGDVLFRASAYGSWMMVKQQGTAEGFDSDHYDAIKRSYTIWICMRGTEDQKNQYLESTEVYKDQFGKYQEKDFPQLAKKKLFFLGKAEDVEKSLMQNVDILLRLLDTIFAEVLEKGKRKNKKASRASRKAKLENYGFTAKEINIIERNLKEMGSFQQAAIEEGANRVIMILELYSQGLSVKEIARKVGCSESFVRGYISRSSKFISRAVSPAVP